MTNQHLNVASQAMEKMDPTIVEAASGVGVRYLKYDHVKVVVGLDSVGTTYVTALFDNAESAISHQGGKIQFNLDELSEYVRTLIAVRCAKVTRSKLPNWLTAKNDWVIPAFVSVVLENIGEVKDVGLGIHISPEMEEVIIDELVFNKVERELRSLAKLGFEYASAIPRAPSGSWDFMTMQVVDSEIANHDGKAHACYSLLRSFVNMSTIQSVLLPRVSYGHSDRFKPLLAQLARFK